MNACYVQYLRGANLLKVADVNGTSWSNGIAPGSSDTTGNFNPYCTINGIGSGFSVSGAQLLVTASITFQPAFAGAKNNYLIAYDQYGLNSGWQQVGTWTVGVTPVTPPVWTISSTHSGNFTRGQSGAVYTVTVSNQTGAGASVGTATVTETAPSGLALVSMSGSGWSCVAGSNTCTRSNSLAAGQSYPPITVTVSVLPDAVSPIVNQVSVSGGGAASPASATDSTVVTGAPLSLMASPPGASGHRQVFTFTWSDPQGYASIGSLQVKFTNTQSTANSCWMRFDQAASTIYLRNNAGTEMAAAPLGAGAAVQNSQCAVYPAETTISGSGNQLTLVLSMGFFTSYSGAQSIWMEANNGADSGWGNAKGTYTVNDQQPTIDGVSPSSGRGWTQTFAFTFSDADGTADLYNAQVNFNNSYSQTPHSCYVMVMLGTKAIYLADDNGNLQAPVIAGNSGLVQNSQCSINAPAASVQTTGNSTTLNLGITFASTYAGQVGVWSTVQDQALVSAAWSNAGNWLVGPLQDYTVGVTPASQTLLAGESRSYTVNLTAINGFSGSYTFSASGLPGNATASFGPVSNGSTTMTVTTAKAENGGPPGEFDITITAVANGISHTTVAHLSVQDFVVSLSPPVINGKCRADYTVYDQLNPSSDPVYTTTVNGVNGYGGNVFFPVPTASPTFIWGSGTSTPIVSANGGTAILGVGARLDYTSCNNANLVYNITWNPSAWGLPVNHPTVGQLTVNQGAQQLTVLTVTSPPNQTVTPPNGALYGLTVTSKFGYSSAVSGNVVLTASALPAGWTAVFTPSTVYVDGSTAGFAQLRVTPPAGAAAGAFASFSILASGGASGFGASVTVNAAVSNNMTITSSPAGLTFQSNGVNCLSPCVAAKGSSITAPTQVSTSNVHLRYVFTGWSTGSTVNPQTFNADVTANFKRQFELTVSATAGGTVNQASSEWIDEASPAATRTLTATAATGYVFAGFSGDVTSGASSVQLTMDGPKNIVATFAAVGGGGAVSIVTSPAGLPVTINGVACSANCTATVGQILSVTRTATLAGDPQGKRYYFTSWPGGSSNLEFTIPSNPAASYVATFRTQYQVSVAPSPTTGGGTVTISPTGTPDLGWYDSGSAVQFTVTPISPNQFLGYSGATITNNQVTVTGPMTLTANFGQPMTEYIRVNGRVIAIEKH